MAEKKRGRDVISSYEPDRALSYRVALFVIAILLIACLIIQAVSSVSRNAYET